MKTMQHEEQQTNKKQPMVKDVIVSFFSGCGGFDLGFSSAGFSIGLALDVDAIAVESYNHNRDKHVCHVADLAETDPETIAQLYSRNCSSGPPRGVIGGAPCQTFSNGNVHFNGNDARHLLPRRYACMLRILNEEYDLDFFVFENVKGITSPKHRNEYTTIKRLFSRAGFKLFEGELDAADFGVAQHRRRVFIVGFNKRKYPDLEFKFPTAETTIPLTVASKLKGLPPPLLFKRGIRKDEIAFHPNHWTMNPRSRKFTDGSLSKGHKQGRSFRVLEWEKPSLTVAYGNREINVHPDAERRLSVYEAMLLQGFPRNYELLGTLSDQIRQVSDAIPPQLGLALGKAIHRTLHP
ncbi:MAG: DNA cytosine methyltransferase [Deltaproteobacteria bacterium]|nr:DNA cytosine methyltransferase [Deltaproteobacteria bacterium]